MESSPFHQVRFRIPIIMGFTSRDKDPFSVLRGRSMPYMLKWFLDLVGNGYIPDG